jgi:hypothetical protein
MIVSSPVLSASILLKPQAAGKLDAPPMSVLSGRWRTGRGKFLGIDAAAF